MDEAACKTLLCFDMTSSAGFHAQLTGILAGLAFASIVLILQSTSLSGRGAEAGLLSFFSALITLLIAAFLYGTAAGEERIAGRAAIMVFLAGITSTVAVLELFYGLTWLVRAGGFPNATEMTARITALVIPLITFVYLALTALNEVSITTGREVVGTPIFVFLLLVSLLLLLVRWWCSSAGGPLGCASSPCDRRPGWGPSPGCRWSRSASGWQQRLLVGSSCSLSRTSPLPTG